MMNSLEGSDVYFINNTLIHHLLASIELAPYIFTIPSTLMAKANSNLQLKGNVTEGSLIFCDVSIITKSKTNSSFSFATFSKFLRNLGNSDYVSHYFN